jgi:D-lactate dehydrogenase
MKIGFFETQEWERKIISQQFPEEQIHLSVQKIDKLNIPDQTDFEILSIFVGSEIDQEVLEQFPKLKFICTRSTGFDHIDLQACKKRNVLVSYVPGYASHTVAEFTFGLILSLTRKIYQSVDQVKERGSFSLEGLRGVDLKGKTIGVIGTGRIGRQVVRIAKGFSMKVLAADPFPDLDFQKEMGFSYVPLEDLLKGSDIITLHCPYNKNTYHLINRENIHLIKKGAFLINTARGEVVETRALIEALQKGILAGAGLDVLEEEEEIKDELNLLVKAHPQEQVLRSMLYGHILMDLPNVLVTPHNAFNSQEALERLLNTSIENIKSFIKGEPINLAKLS